MNSQQHLRLRALSGASGSGNGTKPGAAASELRDFWLTSRRATSVKSCETPVFVLALVS